jgi:hypothetical integral membrane protein (TIGR02206 family)
MDSPAFHPFSATHGATLLVGGLTLAVLLVLAKRSERADRGVQALLVLLNLGAYAYSQAAWSLAPGMDKDLDSVWPLQLCDVAAVSAGFALITRHPRLILLTYFWGLAGTIQALLTPAIQIGFPHPAYLSFFIQHFAIIAVALYFPINRGWRGSEPWWKAPLAAWGWSQVYLVIAGITNGVLGTNFGFLAHKPSNPSLLDLMGPWPWYLIPLEGLALALFILLALPLRFGRK